MRFRLVFGCFAGSCNPLYFVLDSQRNRIVWWYSNEHDAKASINALNKGGK